MHTIKKSGYSHLATMPEGVVHVAEGEVHADDHRGRHRLADGVAERDDVPRAARVQSGGENDSPSHLDNYSVMS